MGGSLGGGTYTTRWIPCYYIVGFGMVVLIPKLKKGQKLNITSVRVYNNTSWTNATASVPVDNGSFFTSLLSGNFQGFSLGNVFLCEISYVLS